MLRPFLCDSWEKIKKYDLIITGSNILAANCQINLLINLPKHHLSIMEAGKLDELGSRGVEWFDKVRLFNIYWASSVCLPNIPLDPSSHLQKVRRKHLAKSLWNEATCQTKK